MKKISVLFLLATMFAINTKAQTKSGILKKDNYGSFTGDDWEDFLAGRRADEFEKKSNVKLLPYLQNQVLPFVNNELKEPTIASAVANSTVVSFPEGAMVHTITTDGTWIDRVVYPGEKGFFHTATGMYWISFSCGNLTAFGPGPKKSAVTTASYTGPNLNPTNPTSNPFMNNSSSSNNVVNNQEISWNAGYGIYSAGRNDRTTDFSQDALMFMAIQKSSSSNCGGCGATTATQVVSQPLLYTAPTAAVAQQTVGNQQLSGNLNVTVKEKANANDWVNTGLYALNTGANLYTAIHGQKVILSGGGNGYSTGWTIPDNTGGGFQGSNQQGNILSGGGSAANLWSTGNTVSTVGSGINTWTIR